MRLLIALMLAFSANAFSDNHEEAENSKSDVGPATDDPIVTTCKITAEDIGKLQSRAKMLEEQADIDMSASRPLLNPEIRNQLVETWGFMMENAEYYANLNCHEHLYETPRREHRMKRKQQEKSKGWFD